MKTICRITVFSDSLPELEKIAALGASRIEIQNSTLYCPCFFDVDDCNPHFDEILALVELIKKKASVQTSFHLVYSEEERSNAEFFHVRSTYAGLDSAYDPNQYELLHYYDTVTMQGKKLYDRFEHVRQIGSIIANKKPIWKTTRQFCSDYGSAMQNLYCSDFAKKVIESGDLTGVEFYNVLSAKTRSPLSDLWQLWPKECEDFLAAGPFMQTRTCKECGRTRYYTAGGRTQIKIRKECTPEGLDFLQVPGAVGADTGYPYIIVSRKAYFALTQAKIVRSMVFEPLCRAE